MANSNNMYGANLKEYALEVLRNKQVARSTMINWTGVIKWPFPDYQEEANPVSINLMSAYLALVNFHPDDLENEISS